MSARMASEAVPVAQGGEHEELLRLLGFVLLAHGRGDKAVLVFDVLHLFMPDDEQVALSLGYALIQCGRVSDALRLIDSLRLPHREPATLALLRGKALSSLGRGIEATKAMRRFARLRQQEQHRDP